MSVPFLEVCVLKRASVLHYVKNQLTLYRKIVEKSERFISRYLENHHV